MYELQDSKNDSNSNDDGDVVMVSTWKNSGSRPIPSSAIDSECSSTVAIPPTVNSIYSYKLLLRPVLLILPSLSTVVVASRFLMVGC